MRRRRAKPSKTLTVLGWIFWLALTIALAFCAYEVIQLQIFTRTQMMVVLSVMAVLFLLFTWLLLRQYVHNGWKIFWIVLCVIVTGISGVGGYYLMETGAFFAMISGEGDNNENREQGFDDSDIMNEADRLTNQMAMTVTTYALTETGITQLSDLNGRVVGVITAMDEKGTNGALEQLRSKDSNPETREYDNAFTLIDALYNHEIDAAVLPEQFHGDLLDAANDYNKYNALTTFSNVVDQYIYYEPIPEEMKNPADEVPDITKDPFTVLISGSDSYGNLSTTSRSDVNMLVTVNPVTHEVLLVSLPRDTYMPFSCKKNEMACGYAAGQYDKLTHSGIYGVGTTESSIEDFLGVEINYTVRVNFSSLINIVDAIGGVDVEVEPGLEVDTFYANGTEGVHAGVNHLNGERALAFARERHAYLNGDNQRVINQQILMKALLKSMMSPTMVINYPKFIRALSTAFTTNMPGTQIRQLISLEISSFPSWNIQSYAISGNPEMRLSAALNAEASVSIVDEGQVQVAKNLIDDVIEGREVVVPDPETVPNVPTDTESTSQDATYNPIYEEVPDYNYDYNYDYNNGYDANETPVEPTPQVPVEPVVPEQTPEDYPQGDGEYYE